MADIETVLEQCTPSLLRIQDVLGVGRGELNGAPTVVVLVKQLTPLLRTRLPQQVDGFLVQVKEVGGIQAAKD